MKNKIGTWKRVEIWHDGSVVVAGLMDVETQGDTIIVTLTDAQAKRLPYSNGPPVN